jgi:uncharacterized cofD-like protein
MMRRLNLIAIGGGTGLSSLLSGLKHYVYTAEAEAGGADQHPTLTQLTALVTVTDDGGSSGRLRDEFQILPPGDIRNCMVALAEDEQLLTRLFRYRFRGRGQLGGHSFGNLFLTALTGVTGDFWEAIKLSSEVLAIKGRIFPSTMTNVHLEAELDDGAVVRGESNITKATRPIRSLRLNPLDCHPLPETLEAIAQADLIVIGPGSLFTSLIPNLLVKGIPEAIVGSSAKKMYVCNIMTQPNETNSYTVGDHVQRILEYCPGLALDLVLINSQPVSEAIRQKYLADGAVQVHLEEPVKVDTESGMGYLMLPRVGQRIPNLCRDLIEERETVRHHPLKLSQAIFEAYRLLTQRSGLRSEVDV